MIWGYDFEVFKRLWTVTFINPITREKVQIVNDRDRLTKFYKTHKNDILVGFNSRFYDDWIYKAILCKFDPWDMNEWIILKDKKGYAFSSVLSRINLNSFDCMTGFYGLKTLEGFCGMDIRETEIPFDYDGEFTQDMIDKVLYYNEHDVMATLRVFIERKAEFDSYMGLIKMFNLPLSYLSKTKAQLSAIILGAKSTKHKDEFDISIPPTIEISKYQNVVNFFRTDWNYETGLETDIAGVPHVYGTGGLHGAIPNYYEEGEFLHVDVGSMYPSIMIRYPEYCMSRTGASLERFTEIRDRRIEFKKAKDKRADSLKIVLNGTYGSMKDKYNPLYDARSANNVCIFGQLLITDLIEHLEGVCDLIQTNTDAVIVKLRGNRDEVVAICKDWEERSGLTLDYHDITKIVQKDVNNYVAVFANGKVESKGAYVKELNDLDYDLPIVNEAVKQYILHGTHVSTTINNCTDFRAFQKIVKLSSKYKWVEHEQGHTVIGHKKRGGVIYGYRSTTKYDNKAYRVYASKDKNDGRLLKCKPTDKKIKKDKFGNTPDNCFIYNGDVNNVPIPDKLDKSWYVKTATDRLKDFGVI